MVAEWSCYGSYQAAMDNILQGVEWNYYSYQGVEVGRILESIKEVSPKEKTITVYE